MTLATHELVRKSTRKDNDRCDQHDHVTRYLLQLLGATPMVVQTVNEVGAIFDHSGDRNVDSIGGG